MQELKILMLEDSADDADLVQRCIRKDGIKFTSVVITSRKEFIQSLSSFSPDIILADHKLPQFSSLEALDIVRDKKLNVPVILVTGSVSEDFAAESIKKGAVDYILKDNLTRLPNAIRMAFLQKQSAERVMALEQQFRAFMDNSPAVQWIKDKDGKYLFINKAFEKRHKISQEEITGKTAFDFLPQETAKVIKQNERKVLSTGQAAKSVEIIPDSEGKQVHNLVYRFPIQPYLIGGVGIDITDRVKSEEQLHYKIRELDTFIYRASHDLRGPLASLLGLMNVAKMEIADPVSQKYFTMISESTQRMDSMLSDLVKITKISQGVTTAKEINVEVMIGEILKSLSFLEEFKGIDFRVNVSATLLSDPDLLLGILQNLIDNSIRYRKENFPDSYIDISVIPAGTGVMITVRDNGQGIPPDIQPKIFDMFFRGNLKSSGTGLGLYIVKTTIDKLRGTIAVESVQDEWTKFSVFLPHIQ
ncbi:MAG: response regulator [Bacteroidetes bacterium]|nr:response regulator [Bacteroidota bacterium]